MPGYKHGGTMTDFTLLHTSDWHLGHQLYSRRRNEEFEAFLNWLVKLIAARNIDAIIIAGDVFHTTLPDIQAQRLYYDFLDKAAKADARHIIVTAGNHDSPWFLAAPGPLLANLNVHVIGTIGDEAADEILVLKDVTGRPQAIICAVPFLRERDAREFGAGEDNLEKAEKLAAGIRAHYRAIASLAEQIRGNLDIPIIATGHLFATGASPDKEVRNLYIGGSGAVSQDIFANELDYVALGHIHRPQKIGASEFRRYSGSPIPIHFDEATQTKTVLLVHFQGRKPEVEICPIPVFRHLVTLSGSQRELLEQLRQRAADEAERQKETWFELRHDGSDNFGDLHENAKSIAQGLPWAILNCIPSRRQGGSLEPTPDTRIEDFTPEEIFRRRLELGNYDEQHQQELLMTFRELLASVYEQGGI